MTRGMKLGITIIILLLLVNALGTTYLAYRSFATEERQKVAAQQLTLIADEARLDLEDYHAAAYESDQVDRISEQQLLATETEISLLIKVVMSLAMTIWN